jgi:hypothetical protein
VLISSHRKLLCPKGTVVNVATIGPPGPLIEHESAEMPELESPGR